MLCRVLDGWPGCRAMFVRVKKIGGYEYLCLVENAREGGRHVQRVIKSLGRRDEVEASGLLDSLIASAAHHSRRSIVLSRFYRGELPELKRLSIGPDLVFGRLWQDLGCRDVLRGLLARPPLRVRRRASRLSGGAAPPDGVRLGSPCQRMAPLLPCSRRRRPCSGSRLQGDELARRGDRQRPGDDGCHRRGIA